MSECRNVSRVSRPDLDPALPGAGPPLTARSVLASTLLGTDPPELPVAQLVAVAALFGITENRARVALTRMVRAGEAVTDAGRYRLTGRLAERGKRQQQSRRPARATWRGGWTMVVLTGERRLAVERAEHRRSLLAARCAELREGVWMRPDNLPLALPPDLVERAQRMTARPDEPVALAERLWDLTGWQRRASVLVDRLATAPSADVLAEGFVLSAAVLRHLQADPLLPDELLPTSWPGDELRAVYDGWDTAYRRLLSDWHRAWRDRSARSSVR